MDEKVKESNARRIVVEYEDGTVKELEKGCVFIFDASNEDTDIHITAEMVGMTGSDLYDLVYAAVNLGYKIGMFKEG